MDEETILDSAVAQKDRISVDVTDIKEEIENCRSDVAWAELALAAKVRVLVKERLEQLKAEAQASGNVPATKRSVFEKLERLEAEAQSQQKQSPSSKDKGDKK